LSLFAHIFFEIVLFPSGIVKIQFDPSSFSPSSSRYS
jgi:hypothetical protein